MVKCIRLINRPEALEVAAISPVALSRSLYVMCRRLCSTGVPREFGKSEVFGKIEACRHRALATLIYVEMDETYVGGKNWGKGHGAKNDNKEIVIGRPTSKKWSLDLTAATGPICSLILCAIWSLRLYSLLKN
jgi:hypothetical protein